MMKTYDYLTENNRKHFSKSTKILQRKMSRTKISSRKNETFGKKKRLSNTQ